MKKSTIFALAVANLLIINAFFYIVMQVKETAWLYSVVSNVSAVICSLLAVLGIFVAITNFKRYDFIKLSWIILLSGVCLYFLAETIYAVCEIGFRMDMDLIFPSVADWLWVVGYVPLIGGMVMFLHGYRMSGLPLGGKKFYIELFIVSMLIISFISAYIFVPIVKDSGISAMAKTVYVVYLTGDFVLIILSMILAHITGLLGVGLASRPWRCIAFGFIFITLSDIAYSYLTWQSNYSSGSFVDIGWNTGYLLIGLAGFYQKELFDSIGRMKR